MGMLANRNKTSVDCWSPTDQCVPCWLAGWCCSTLDWQTQIRSWRLDPRAEVRIKLNSLIRILDPWRLIALMSFVCFNTEPRRHRIRPPCDLHGNVKTLDHTQPAVHSVAWHDDKVNKGLVCLVGYFLLRRRRWKRVGGGGEKVRNIIRGTRA